MENDRQLTRTAGQVAHLLTGSLTGDEAASVVGVRHDSREVLPGEIFCCIRGDHHDGHDHAAEAVRRGASCLVVERRLDAVDAAIPQIQVPDTRQILGKLSASIYGEPSAQLRVVGVTGTNGKTSTVAVMASILTTAGVRTESMGTLTGVRTTPEADDLQRALRQMSDSGVSALAMEVSSHALSQRRVDGTLFEVSIFTNLSRDHLDFHGDMDSYFAAKARLFDKDLSGRAVVNVDDAWGLRLARECAIPVTTYSLGDVTDIGVSASEVRFVWRGRVVTVPIGGRFTVANALAAMTAAEAMGIDPDVIVEGCARVAPVAGRFEAVPNTTGISVIVDYAHTPDGLEVLLASAREVCDGRVIVVFGCGGERDAGKREPMGAAATAADVVIITSDNPRGEDPGAIIEAIAGGVRAKGAQPIVEPDRALAIASAISVARRGDMVVIAGKGHERTQEIAGVLHPFVDAEIAASVLARQKGEKT